MALGVPQVEEVGLGGGGLKMIHRDQSNIYIPLTTSKDFKE